MIAFAVPPVTAGVIWTGASTGRINVTRDGGRTWSDVTPPDLPPGIVNVIDASHHDAATAYVALLSRDAHPHLYRTTDYGATWSAIVAGVREDGVARTIREDPKDASIVYAGTVTGVTRYAVAVDAKDWPAVRGCFTPDAECDYAWFKGDLDTVLDAIERGLARFESTTHLVGNHLAEVDGDVSMPDLRSSERWREIAYEDHLPTADTPAWRTVTLVKA